MTFAFVAIAMLAIPNVSKATEIKFQVTIIADSCQPQPYSGYYCVYVTVKNIFGDVLCQFQDCTLVLGLNQIDYNCDDFLQVHKPNYEIDIRLCRQNSPSCCVSNLKSNLWPENLNDNSVHFYETLY